METIDNTFRALGDPTRRAIIERLALGEARVTDIAGPLPMSLNAVSKHVKILEDAGLVSRRVEGRVHTIDLKENAFDAARDWMNRQEKYWRERLSDLQDFMREEISKNSDNNDRGEQ